MQRLRIRLRRDFDYTNLSRRHPESTIHLWCNFTRDVVEAHSPSPGHAARLADDLRRVVGGRFLHRTAAPDATFQAFTCHCVSHGLASGITVIVERHGGAILPPLVYEGGHEYVSILLLEDDQASSLLAALSKKGPMEVLLRRRLRSPLISQTYLVAVEELLAALTPLQAQAILDAHGRGYYEVPRRANAQQVARALGVPRTTHEEHLRKGERKILDALAPYLRLLSAARPRTRLAPRGAEPSRNGSTPLHRRPVRRRAPRSRAVATAAG